MNYENASDLEIAIKVAKVKKLDWQISAVDGDAVMVDYEVFDPCENPEDAWPIILENQISLINLYTQDQCDSGNWEAQSTAPADIGLNCYFSQHINPLRAAMIVFLMMQEEA